MFRIKCERTFALLSEIINSLPLLATGQPHQSIRFGNLLLSPIILVREASLVWKFYYRYCDDIVILHDDINYLRMVKEIIRIKLAQIDLNCKRRC